MQNLFVSGSQSTRAGRKGAHLPFYLHMYQCANVTYLRVIDRQVGTLAHGPGHAVTTRKHETAVDQRHEHIP